MLSKVIRHILVQNATSVICKAAVAEAMYVPAAESTASKWKRYSNVIARDLSLLAHTT